MLIGGPLIPYIAGGIVGAAYGFLVGLIKYTALWKNTIKNDTKMTTGALYLRLGISYAINIATLLLVFLTRNVNPWSFEATIIAAGVALALAGKLAPAGSIFDNVKFESKGVAR